MQSLQAFALAATLAGFATASPVEVRGANTFSVQQVSVGPKVVPAPAIALMNAYAKFAKAGAVAPSSVVAAAAAASQTGQVTATPQDDDEVCLIDETRPIKLFSHNGLGISLPSQGWKPDFEPRL